MSGKNSYPEITLGPSLERLLRPGRICIEGGGCGWLVIRKRRNKYYVYLQAGNRDIYLGPLARFQPAPTTLVIRYSGDGELVVDVDYAPGSPQKLIGTVKALGVIAGSLPAVEQVLNQLLSKYKVR